MMASSCFRAFQSTKCLEVAKLKSSVLWIVRMHIQYMYSTAYELTTWFFSCVAGDSADFALFAAFGKNLQHPHVPGSKFKVFSFSSLFFFKKK